MRDLSLAPRTVQKVWRNSKTYAHGFGGSAIHFFSHSADFSKLQIGFPQLRVELFAILRPIQSHLRQKTIFRSGNLSVDWLLFPSNSGLPSPLAECFPSGFPPIVIHCSWLRTRPIAESGIRPEPVAPMLLRSSDPAGHQRTAKCLPSRAKLFLPLCHVSVNWRLRFKKSGECRIVCPGDAIVAQKGEVRSARRNFSDSTQRCRSARADCTRSPDCRAYASIFLRSIARRQCRRKSTACCRRVNAIATRSRSVRS